MKQLLRIITLVVLMQITIVATVYAAPPAGGEPDRGNPGGCGYYHTVQYGETLYSIGRAYGVNPHQIAAANGLYNPDHIYAGQSLHIPCHDGYQPKPQPGHGKYPWYGYRYPSVGYGYDFTGYYYEVYSPHYKRYSYTCGYYFNCY
jgi:hypothetical protein